MVQTLKANKVTLAELTMGKLTLTAATLSVPGIFVAVIGAISAVFVWHRVAGRATY